MDDSISEQKDEAQEQGKKVPIPFNRPPEVVATPLFENILKSGVYIDGRYTRELEDTVRDDYGAKYCLALSSATIALIHACAAVKELYFSKQNDVSVAAPAFTWPSTVIAAMTIGKNCSLLDIDPETFLMVPTDEFDVVVPVATFGSNYDQNLRDCYPDSHIIYDCAHSLGAYISQSEEWDVAVFSLAPTKPVPSADGGLLLTDDVSIAKKVNDYRRVHGRMSEFSAAIALRNYVRAEFLINERVRVHRKYAEALPFRPQRCLVSSHSVSAFLLDEPSQPMVDALDGDVELRRYYSPVMKGLLNTDSVYERIVCLPSYVGVDTTRVISAVCDAWGRLGDKDI